MSLASSPARGRRRGVGHACALEGDEPVAAHRHDLVEQRLDARPRVDRDRDHRQVLGERQQPIGVQMVLDAEAGDAAQHEARAQLVAGIEVGQRIGQEAIAGAVALAEVGRQLQCVGHSAPPIWSPSHTQARPSARLTSDVGQPQPQTPVLAEAMGLEHPRAERRVGAEQPGAEEAQRVAAHAGAVQDPERQRPAQVDRQRPPREGARRARGHRAVEQEARDRARAAEEPDADHHERRHAASRARRTRLVVSAMASQPGGHARQRRSRRRGRRCRGRASAAARAAGSRRSSARRTARCPGTGAGRPTAAGAPAGAS